MSDPDSILAFFTRQIQRRTPTWLSPTLSVVILAMLVFAGVLAWTPPAPSFAQPATATTTPTDAFMIAPTAAREVLDTETPAAPVVKPTRTPTAIPIEWQNNEKETDGVIFGAIVLVLIVIGGTLHAIRRNGS